MLDHISSKYHKKIKIKNHAYEKNTHLLSCLFINETIQGRFENKNK